MDGRWHDGIVGSSSRADRTAVGKRKHCGAVMKRSLANAWLALSTLTEPAPRSEYRMRSRRQLPNHPCSTQLQPKPLATECQGMMKHYPKMRLRYRIHRCNFASEPR